MKTLLAFLFTVGLLAGAAHFAMDKGYIVDPLHYTALHETTVLNDLASKANNIRERSKLPALLTDTALTKWLEKNGGSVTAHESSVDVLLNRLQSSEPSVASTSAQYVSSNKAEEVLETLQQWASSLSADKTEIAIHIFPQSRFQSYRVVAIAAEGLPEFSPNLLSIENDGVSKKFYNKCASCGKTHSGVVQRQGLALPLQCSHCNEIYDVYAMKLDGSYCRVTELLAGYERTANFPAEMTKYDKMIAVWRTVVTGFAYDTDIKISSGPQDSWQTALETSKIGSGDCEDTSILLADWLISLGINARVAVGSHISGGGHAWCVAEIDGNEYLLETTSGEHTDFRKPPSTSRYSHEYMPMAMFDRERLFFREGEGWTPEYFTSNGWRAIEYPMSKSPHQGENYFNMALSAGLSGMDRVPTEE
jgi:predicted transglutaminase-like cysteine proteinase